MNIFQCARVPSSLTYVCFMYLVLKLRTLVSSEVVFVIKKEKKRKM